MLSTGVMRFMHCCCQISIRFCAGLIIFCSLNSCGHLSEKEYRKWSEASANGLHYTRHIDGINLDVRYLTTEFRWLQAKKPELFEMWMRENRNTHHFILKINWQSFPNKITSRELNYYLSYNLQNDIYLQSSDGSKIPCMVAHLENPQISSHDKIVHLAFDSNSLTLPEFTFVIESEVISSVPIKMHFDLSKLPDLKI